jgi:hypothetical protein
MQSKPAKAWAHGSFWWRHRFSSSLVVHNQWWVSQGSYSVQLSAVLHNTTL